MTTYGEYAKAEAAAEPVFVASNRLNFSVASSATESSTTAARPNTYLAIDTTAMTAQPNNDGTRHPQLDHPVTSSSATSRQNTIPRSQATATKQNAVLTVAQSQANSMEPGIFPIYSASPSGSAVDSRHLGFVACSVTCSYCGGLAHNQDMCRKRKAVVGCLNCGVKGHLEHQCGKTSGNQCRYCLKQGHSEATCVWLKNDTCECPYCFKFGHPEFRCNKKKRDLASKTHLAGTAFAGSDRLDGVAGPNRKFELNIKSMVAPVKAAPRRDPIVRDNAADNKNANHGHRAPVTPAGKNAIDMQNNSAQTEIKAEPRRFQVPKSTSSVLPVKYKLSPTNASKPTVLADKTIHSNSPQEPISESRESHRHDHHGTHGGGSRHDRATPPPKTDSVVPTSTSKSNLKPRGGLGVSTNTRRPKSANSSPTIYTFQDAHNSRRVQQQIPPANYEFLEFQRKLMKERREGAIRLRREQNRIHC
ncbi:hypothetical protein VMCG_07639 [Cytospora schulzeri]|uniref:CCHC-type domain-containing protein n=1 Tax=Cytospora schulzeri TaxID=448051 RepID=A0A423VX86_9PEZI|nr:hypothetical protein VMCG_07639 [Valsa malicola]